MKRKLEHQGLTDQTNPFEPVSKFQCPALNSTFSVPLDIFKYIQISNILTSHWCSQLSQTRANSPTKAEHLSAQKNELWLRLPLWHTCPKYLWSFSMGILVARLLTVIAVQLIKERGIKANSKPSNWRVIPYLKQDSTRFKKPEPINTHHGFQFNHTSYRGSRPSSCFTSAPAIRHPPQRWSEFAHQSGAPSRSKSSGHRRCPPELLDSASVDHDGGWVVWWGLDCISDNLLI